MGTIFITNRNDFHHVDRYDGVEYHFPPGEKVAIPQEAATHLFGTGLADRSETLVRLGWAMRYDPKTKQFEEDASGVRKLANFIATRAVMVEENESVSAKPAAEALDIA
jgi:hypothetical protein